MKALRYVGRVQEFRSALQAARKSSKNRRTMLADDLGRRRFQRELRRAEMASIRAAILRKGGDAA